SWGALVDNHAWLEEAINQEPFRSAWNRAISYAAQEWVDQQVEHLLGPAREKAAKQIKNVEDETERRIAALLEERGERIKKAQAETNRQMEQIRGSLAQAEGRLTTAQDKLQELQKKSRDEAERPEKAARFLQEARDGFGVALLEWQQLLTPQHAPQENGQAVP